MEETQHAEKERWLSAGGRTWPDWKVYLAIFAVAAVVSIGRGIVTFPLLGPVLLYFFPLGLWRGMGLRWEHHIALIGGHLLYAAIIVLGSVRRSRVLLIILVVLLLVNIRGCWHIHATSKIGIPH